MKLKLLVLRKPSVSSVSDTRGTLELWRQIAYLIRDSLLLSRGTINMHKFILAVLVFGLFAAWGINAEEGRYSLTDPAYSLDNKLVLGRQENVYFPDVQGLETVPFSAKIDSGADSSSINAVDIHIHTQFPQLAHLKDNELLAAIIKTSHDRSEVWLKDHAKWQTMVSFSMQNPYTGEKTHLERPLVKVSQIRSRSSKQPILRPRINIKLRIAGKTVSTPVNLTDRRHFSSLVLIGRTFLQQQAWVLPGYQYLQAQPQALIAGREETVTVNGVKQAVSVSLKHKFSRLQANNVQVQGQQVSFELLGADKKLTVPVVRMLNVSGVMKPLVYLPVQINAKTQQYWLVYVTEKPEGKSPIRLGTSTISRYFVIEPAERELFARALQTYQPPSAAKTLLLAPNDEVELDSMTVSTTLAPARVTPVLHVEKLHLYHQGKQGMVEYRWPDGKGGTQKIAKPVVRWVKVGKHRHPVVTGSITIHGKVQPLDFALDSVGHERPKPYLTLGRTLNDYQLLVNTRVDNLLLPHPLFKAGHIEMAQVGGMRFPVKLDSGADVSSISAQDIHLFKKEDKKMVRFVYRNKQGDKKTFELPVDAMMRVKAKKGEKAKPRPVVTMTVKLGDVEEAIQVNLQDRSRFEYSMILGKNFLKYGVLVGSAANYQLGK